MKKLSTLLLAAVTSTLTVAQTDSSSSSKQFKLVEARISLGMFNNKNALSDIGYFNTLSGNQSTILPDNLTAYSVEGGYSGSGLFSLQLGWIKKSKKTNDYNNNRIFRLGIDFYTPSIMNYSYRNEKIARIDTLTSSQNGSSYYVDSVITDYYNAAYNSSVLQVTFSAIYSTSQAHQVALYGGLEGALGITFNNYTNISYYTDFSNRITLANNVSTYEQSRYNVVFNSAETFRNKTGFTAALGVPLGIDLRLGKKREFWEKLHLFSEVTPYISLFYVPELFTHTITGIKTRFGLRVTF